MNLYNLTLLEGNAV